MPPAKPKSLEQLSEELELAVQHIPVEDIEADPENPNEMDAGLYATLVADIKQYGFTQPILVRPSKTGFKLIDGEHRWKAVSELGYATIPAVVIDTSDDDATLRLLTMNRLRGQVVPIRVAYLLADLAKRIPEKQLRQRLGMEAGEFNDKLRLAGVHDEVRARLRATEGSARRAKSRQSLRFTVSREGAQIVERVIDLVAGDTQDRGEALVIICEAFERANRVEGSSPRRG